MGAFYKHGLTYLDLAWMNNHMSSKVWDEIIFPSQTCTVEILEWKSNFTLRLMMVVITYPSWD